MKTIIAGSRTCNNIKYVYDAVSKCGWNITEVISGTARGADTLGEEWAKENGIPIRRFPANWNKYGKAAGHIRNSQMADVADALIAIWDGKSRGTEDMIYIAKICRLKVFVYRFEDALQDSLPTDFGKVQGL